MEISVGLIRFEMWVWLELKSVGVLVGFEMWVWLGLKGGKEKASQFPPQHTRTYREVRNFAFTLTTLCRETLTALFPYV